MQQLGIPLRSEQIDALLLYHAELIRWNQKINLTGLRDPREIVIKHFLDSLTPLAFLRPNGGERWVDIGTGAGFPGLVLKIAHPEVEMMLIEATGKKVTFLHHLIGLLRLKGVSVVHDRLERLQGPEWQGVSDLLTTRALAPAFVLENGATLVRKGGRMLFFKGAPDRSGWEELLKKHPKWRLEQIFPVALPFTDESRSLILLKGDDD